MNDGIMYTFDVVQCHSHGTQIHHRCARQETAEYLMAWCEALDEDNARQYCKVMRHAGFSEAYLSSIDSNAAREGAGKFSLVESEVIL